MSGPNVHESPEKSLSPRGPASPEDPLTGGCLCGGVRFEITAPFTSAGYCHCTRCQRRTGTAASANGSVAREAFRLVSGQDLLRSFTPPAGGAPKVFCSNCGSAIFSGSLDADDRLGIRLGALDADPGIRPQWHQYAAYAVPWEPIPDDGLSRHAEARS